MFKIGSSIFKLTFLNWMIFFRFQIFRGFFMLMLAFIFYKLSIGYGKTLASLSSNSPPLHTITPIYFLISQWVVFSTPQFTFTVNKDLVNSRFDLTFISPLSAPIEYIFRCFSQFIVQLVCYLPFVILGFYLFNSFPNSIVSFLLGTILILVSGLIVTLTQILIGLLGGVSGRVQILNILWHKSALLLGGVMIPFSVLPPQFVQISKFTPFPIMFGRVAEFISYGKLNFKTSFGIGIVWVLCLLATVMICGSHVFYLRAKKGNA